MIQKTLPTSLLRTPNHLNHEQRDQDDFEFLVANAHAGRAQGLSHFIHLDQPVGIWNYIRIANEIEESVPRGRLLDWGCGLGQMSYLLQRRGFEVTSFDLELPSVSLPDIPLTRAVEVVRTTHPTKLPFDSGTFDAVLSCGVLEHVDEFSQPGNELRSLDEIRRVLRPEGYFPIYQLPQLFTWQEAITRTLRIGYAHPRRFTEREIRTLLDRKGYRVERLRRNNMLPKNLTGLPGPLRDFYSRFSRSLIKLDRNLSRIPGLNRFAGVLEILARRNESGFVFTGPPT
jgi:SAM-dependent methyltransferase